MSNLIGNCCRRRNPSEVYGKELPEEAASEPADGSAVKIGDTTMNEGTVEVVGEPPVELDVKRHEDLPTTKEEDTDPPLKHAADVISAGAMSAEELEKWKKAYEDSQRLAEGKL